jgi:hypothetical protein
VNRRYHFARSSPHRPPSRAPLTPVHSPFSRAYRTESTYPQEQGRTTRRASLFWWSGSVYCCWRRDARRVVRMSSLTYGQIGAAAVTGDQQSQPPAAAQGVTLARRSRLAPGGQHVTKRWESQRLHRAGPRASHSVTGSRYAMSGAAPIWKRDSAATVTLSARPGACDGGQGVTPGGHLLFMSRIPCYPVAFLRLAK